MVDLSCNRLFNPDHGGISQQFLGGGEVEQIHYEMLGLREGARTSITTMIRGVCSQQPVTFQISIGIVDHICHKLWLGASFKVHTGREYQTA